MLLKKTPSLTVHKRIGNVSLGNAATIEKENTQNAKPEVMALPARFLPKNSNGEENKLWHSSWFWFLVQWRINLHRLFNAKAILLEVQLRYF